MKFIKYILLFVFTASIGQTSLTTLESNYNAGWTAESSNFTGFSNSDDQGELYFLDYGIVGHIWAFQATGDFTYFDRALTLIDNKIDQATASNTHPGPIYADTYLGWYDTDGTWDIVPSDEVPLSDFHGCRAWARPLAIMANNPEIKSMDNGALPGATYQTQYDKILNFIDVNIIEKWLTRGSGNVYRSVTHITSHAAQLGMDMYKATGDTSFLLIADRFFTDMASVGYSNSFMELLRTHATATNAIVWDEGWANTTSGTTDVSHANADYRTLVTAYNYGLYTSTGLSTTYPNVNLDLMQRFANTTNYVADGFDETSKQNVDGSGTSDTNPKWNDGFVLGGMFDATLQEDMVGRTTTYMAAEKHRTVFWGAMMYNRAYLDGAVYYPEYGAVSVTDMPLAERVKKGKKSAVAGITF